jgi:predicted RNase H-like HicB family nuclease
MSKRLERMRGNPAKDGPMTRCPYRIVVEPLPSEDGGGFVATVPDLPGCMSDGDTPEEAVVNVQDAIAAWIEAAHDLGHAVPKPTRPLAATG